MGKHDSLDAHDTGPSEVETQVETVTAETMADIEAKLIAAHIEQDTINLVLREALPVVKALVLTFLPAL